MHLFRKYINNRGSALFMVISVMTAVMVSCMAMYFSVMSSRSTQYAVFNQQQSKQSAVSISDAILAGMMDSNSTALYPLLDKMFNLPIGGKLTTDGNGYAAFDPSGTKEDDPHIGSYMVEITRVSESTFDIIVTSSVNGVKEVYHTIIDLQKSDSAAAPPPPAQVFAATGYVPNDVFLNAGVFLTDVFFDNQRTLINVYPGSAMQLYGNLATGGSLVSKSWFENKSVNQAVYAIRGDYESYFGGGSTFTKISEAKTPAQGERHIVMIGGNCTFAPEENNSGSGFSNADIYILGDLIIDGAGGIGASANENSNYFVNGNVTVTGKVACDLTNVRYNGTFSQPNNDNKVVNLPKKGWGTEEGFAGKKFLTKAEMVKDLDARTATNVYYKWVINDSNADGDKYVAELNENSPTVVHKKTLVYRAGPLNNDWNNIELVPTIILKYNDDKDKGYVEKGCIIEDVKIEPTGNQFTHYALIIDTGDDEDNVYTIRVKANTDMDGDGEKETFCWIPEMLKKNWDGSIFHNWEGKVEYEQHPIHVFVKGRGSVVVDIPEGVVYQDQTDCTFMHYNWAVLGGMTTEKKSNVKVPAGKDEYWDDDAKYWVSNIEYKPNGYMDNMEVKYAGTERKTNTEYKGWIHNDCFYEKDASDNVTKCGCSYKEVKSEEKCESCGGKMTAVQCTVHGEISRFCGKCEPDKSDTSDGAHYGECQYHVGREEIDKFLVSHGAIKDQMEKDSSGNLIYPTVNIFLVSCDESANIRLADKEKNSNHESDSSRSVQQNNFFGYIYAPYMTFKGLGHNSGGGHLRIMGGMTVSDYVIEDSAPFAACWPEKMPTDLMSSECRKNKLTGLASQSWKVSLAGH